MINSTSQKITKVLGLIALCGFGGLLSAQTFEWKPAGPVYNAGRARNMIVDKTNSKILYVGSASSGIFKSVDGGINWAPINDQATVRNISYMAQSSIGKIYVGTGEGFLRAGQKTKAQPGTGLYTLDESVSPAVLTQVVSAASVGTVINRVACSETGLHVAIATNMGIFTSYAGQPFTKATLPGAPTGTNVSGQDVKFDSNGILYCSIGTERGTGNASNASQVFKSDATLSSFTAITPTSLSLPDNFHGRIELAVAPSNPNVVYAAIANKFVNESSATMKGLFVSYDGGQNWALIGQGSSQLDPMGNGGTLASGDYASVITVNPTNPDQLFFGSYSFYVWTRKSGSNTSPVGDWVPLGISFFQNIQYYLHENIHDIKFVSGIFYFITDAGVFRSSDLAVLLPNLSHNFNIGYLPSFQPFYKGMITGQFNSVSIERFPTVDSLPTKRPGMKVTPYSGFVGGTGGNGLTYFSGTYSLVTTELSSLGGEVYNTEYSKILSNAVLTSVGGGTVYRSANIKNSPPNRVNVNKYINSLAKIAPEPDGFINPTYTTTGTPFRLWENYGQIAIAPDSAVFYNDTIPRYQSSMTGTLELTTTKTFNFLTSRPNKHALIDSVVVRTATVQLPMDGTFKDLQTPYLPSERMTIYAPMDFTYSVNSTTTTTLQSKSFTGPATGPITVTLNPITMNDLVSVTFTAPPFATKTITQYPPNATGTAIVVPDPAVYYRVYLTVFYKYDAGVPVTVVDNNISTKTTTYTAVLTNSLSWRYGSALPSTTISALSNTLNSLVTDPQYVLNGGTPTSNPVFTVNLPPGSFVYTINATGTYTLLADPVVYTISAVDNISVTPPYVYTISPGNYTQSTPVFTVDPTGPTDYTITQSGTGTLTSETYSSVSTATYVLNPGNISQSGTVFVVSPTVTTTYTIQGISSNTLAGLSTVKTATAYATSTTFTLGDATVPMAPKNKPFKMPMHTSSRLAMILNTADQTGSQDAIVVSKNPLSMNDPLSFVRVSQASTLTPIWTDDAAGVATTNTMVVLGKPTFLEWSKSGTEIYYATTANKLYRVSHITTLMDLTQPSYSGKFYTDIFKYSAPINSSTLNPVSPYRTTLIGSFDRPITSISVSNDNKNVAVTFNTTSSGTTAIVMYNTNDVRLSNETNIGWSSRAGTLPGTVNVTYSSMMEKNDSKKFFLGTDNGMYYTADIATGSPVWKNVNENSTSKLPNVQIFDIKQQTFEPWDCYNSGQIYIATNGRGIWTTGYFFAPFTVGTEEYENRPVEGKNMSVYPNPTNGNVNIVFDAVENEKATIQVMDISGRMVKSQELGKLNPGETTHSFDTADLNSGVYIVNISSTSNVKRVTKLVVTK